MKKTQEEAVSTVIAMMLILAILATCMAVYTTTYVPGLKQQSEIIHSEDVKLVFDRVASDVDNMYSLGKPAQFTETFALGGGNVLLSPVKSSGTVEAENSVIGTLKIPGKPDYTITQVHLTYNPSFTSWEKQGYAYDNGVVWITKDTKRTPASQTIFTIEDGVSREESIIRDRLSGKYITVATDGNNNTTVTIPKMSITEKHSMTGSGNANILMNASITPIADIQLAAGECIEIFDTNSTSVFRYPEVPSSSNMNLSVRWLNITVSAE
jgi:FlaG/FlaF family flagellin (archaellin)